MISINNQDNVSKQYSDNKNLSIRIKLHQKYSTNPYNYGMWLSDQYHFFEGCRILELGCGTGSLWEGKLDMLPANTSLVLSDFSEGMVDTVKKKYEGYKNITIKQIDIQQIPYPDHSFDIIIANHMLYHVPDQAKALLEIKRVLKPNGTFHASTISTHGMNEYLHNALKDFNPNIDAYGDTMANFTIENGTPILEKYFDTVELSIHNDALEVTETQDLLDWIQSTISISSVDEDDLVGMYDYFEKLRVVNGGTIHIPKRVGSFTCKMPKS